MGNQNPVDHYEANRAVYDRINRKVETTTEVFSEADRDMQRELLDRAVTFALISPETRVEYHEKGYLNVMERHESDEPLTRDAVEQALLSANVNYYKNKARYIVHNQSEPDKEAILDLYDADRLDEMHRMIRDEYLGVGLRKAGFAMALAVTPEKACLDSHVAQISGISDENIYNGVVVEKYENQWDTILDSWPQLAERLSKFMFQWTLFDADMGTVTTHDAFFMSLPSDVHSRF